MVHDYKTYAIGAGKHAYNVAAFRGPNRFTFTVWANNRDQAARRIERDGYIVSDVNMVG